MLNNISKKSIISIVLAFIFYFGVKYIIQINNTHSTDKEVEENLKRVANDFKDKFPIKISDDITIDSAIVVEKSIYYYYTFENVNKDSLDLMQLREDTQASINANSDVAKNPNLALFRKEEIKMYYSYNDSVGRFLFELESAL